MPDFSHKTKYGEKMEYSKQKLNKKIMEHEEYYLKEIEKLKDEIMEAIEEIEKNKNEAYMKYPKRERNRIVEGLYMAHSIISP